MSNSQKNCPQPLPVAGKPNSITRVGTTGFDTVTAGKRESAGGWRLRTSQPCYSKEETTERTGRIAMVDNNQNVWRMPRSRPRSLLPLSIAPPTL